jgi:hypothetical protein
VAFDAEQVTARTLQALECSLDPSFEMLRMTEPVHLELRRRSGPRVREGAREKIFVCLAWREPSSRKVSSAALLPAGPSDPVDIGVSDGGRFMNGNSWARLDVSGLASSENQMFRIACMASSEPEDRGEEWDPLKPWGSDWTSRVGQTVQETQIVAAAHAHASQSTQLLPSYELKATAAPRLVETTDGRIIEVP